MTSRLGLLAIGVALSLTACGHEIAPAERPSTSITHFTGRTELFVEFPALLQHTESAFAVHLTRLDDFKPVPAGRVRVTLSGGGGTDEHFEAAGPEVPGIFRPVVRPREPGERRLAVAIEDDALSDQHDLGTVTVYASAQAAAGSAPEPATSNAVTFLKEQQWRLDFGTAIVTERTLRGSVSAYGALRARPSGEARIAAPLAGRLVSPGEELPALGAVVERNQVLAVVAPRVASDADPAALELAVERARRDLDLARAERQRLERLLAQDAVPARRVLAARHEEKDAASTLAEAEHRLQQYRGVHQGGPHATGRIAVRAPIAGTVVNVQVAPGEFLEEGAAMFDLVDLDALWLEARIPEAEVGRVRRAAGAWFEVDGFEAPFSVGGEHGGHLVTLGGVVDEQSRTLPLIFEIENPRHDLRPGMFARVHILTGAMAPGPAIPVGAVVDEQGESVAYVQAGGERFERRPLRLGVRDGELVQVLEGLTAGERVVSRGAYFVRLAAASGAVPAHGHAH